MGLKKALITEELWPGRGLNPGLPNETPALCPLLHVLTLGTGAQPYWLIQDRPEQKVISADQGCQMVYFQTKNPNFGIF
jgi:hypothetical protein